MKPIENRLKLVVFLLLTAGFLIINFQSPAQNWRKKFDAIDARIDNGDYKLAHEKNKNLKNQIKKSLGPQSAYAAFAQYREADILGSAGYIKAYRKAIDRGIGIAKGAAGRNTLDFAKILMPAIKVIIDYNDFPTASKYLKDIDTIFSRYNKIDQELLDEKTYLEGRIYLQTGQPEKAIENFKKAKVHLENITKKRTYDEKFISNQHNKTYKLTGFEIKQNKKNYATFLTELARAYYENQQLAKADSAFKNAETYINTNISTWDITLINNSFIQIFLKQQSDTSYNPTADYEKLIKDSEPHYSKNHNLILRIKYELIKLYQINNRQIKYEDIKEELDKLYKKYYDENSIYSDYLILVEWHEPHSPLTIKDKIEAGKNMLKKSVAIPKIHRSRAVILDYLEQIAKEAGMTNESEAFRVQKEAILQEISGLTTLNFN